MAGIRGLFVRKSGTVGTTPVAARKDIAGLVAAVAAFGARPGVISGCVVSGTTATAPWTYSVSAGHLVTVRSAADGALPWGNDAAVTVATSAAPASGSRIDIITAFHNDVDNGDANSDPVLGVVQGTAGSPGVAPELPTGAIELGRCTLPSGASTTQGGTFDATYVQYTAARGAPIPVTGTGQRAAITWGSLEDPAIIYRKDTGAIEINRGSGWYAIAQGAWLTYSPVLGATTAPGMGTGAVTNGEYVVHDHMCTVLFDMTLGTGATAGSGTYTMTLPLPAATTGTSRLYGTVHYEDAGTGGGTLFVRGSGSSTSTVTFLIGSSGGSLVTAAAPITWAVGDNIRGTFSYPIA